MAMQTADRALSHMVKQGGYPMEKRRSETIRTIIVSLLLIAALGIVIHYGVKLLG